MEGSVAHPGESTPVEGGDEAPNAPRQWPRWWRQFVVTSRRANVFAWLEVIAGITLIVAIAANYVAYSSQPEDSGGVPALLVSFLLMFPTPE